jgi:hypothetical protein
MSTSNIPPITERKHPPLLLFSHRVIFICNLLFIACAIIQNTPIANTDTIPSAVIVLGYLVAPIFNFLLAVITIARKLLKKLSHWHWLYGLNLLMLMLQWVYLIYVRGV